MASTYFGNTLTDLQSGITAAERNSGDTERSKIAANAAKMAAYFGLLSNKARTEADSRAREAENARSYFALNMADAQKKAEIAARSADAAMEWGERAKLQGLQEKGLTERNAAQIAGQEKVAGLHYGPNNVDPRIAIENKRDQIAKEEQTQMADSLAGLANQALAAAKAKSKLSGSTAWYSPSATPESRRTGMAQADIALKSAISDIQLGLGNNASLIRYNPQLDRFEPALTRPSSGSSPVMLPDVIPGNAIREQAETEPVPMAAIAQPRVINPGVRPAPVNIFGEAGVPFRLTKAMRANQLASQRPDLTREQIIALVNSEFK